MEDSAFERIRPTHPFKVRPVACGTGRDEDAGPGPLLGALSRVTGRSPCWPSFSVFSDKWAKRVTLRSMSATLCVCIWDMGPVAIRLVADPECKARHHGDILRYEQDA
jgi:hypothetical protein